MKQKILITGVAGFIGSNLALRLLREGHDVVGVENLSYGLQEQIPAGVAFYKADIRSKDVYPLFEGVDCVFHLAAKNCIPDCQADPVETADINITGTANVFEAARRAGVRKVVYAESAALYEGVPEIPSNESSVAPETFYGISKLTNHWFAKGYQRFFGLATVGLRYFNVYGPRQDYRRTVPPVMSAFIIKLLKGEQPTIYGTGKKRRDFIHVDDINDFHLLCLRDNRVDNQTFNLGSGESRSVQELYGLIAKAIGSDIKPVYKPDLPGEAEDSRADIEKAKALGWSPKVNIEEGLRNMIEYIQAELDKSGIRT